MFGMMHLWFHMLYLNSITWAHVFPVVLLGVEFQVWCVGGGDYVSKGVLIAQFVFCVSGVGSCMFGFGLYVDGLGAFNKWLEELASYRNIIKA